MTLVVARNSQGRIAVVSDTMVTEHGRALPLQQGTIKSCMLPGGLCVSFANSPDLAARDLRHFATRYPRGASVDDTVALFEKSSADTGNDYILGFSRPPMLVKVAGGRRRPSTAATQWIGDASAHERFREYESKRRRKAEAGRAVSAVLFADEIERSPASDLYSTMRHVIADREISSTGGFACVVSNRGEHYRHSVYSDMLYNWPEGEGEDYVLSLQDQIDFGATGENAGYAIAQISTGFLGLNAVAFYIVKGETLFVFQGAGNGVADKCTVLREVAPANIATQLTEAMGVDLKWLMLVTSPPIAGKGTVPRTSSRTTGPNGVGFGFTSLANTFPSSTGNVTVA